MQQPLPQTQKKLQLTMQAWLDGKLRGILAEKEALCMRFIGGITAYEIRESVTIDQ
ncbi:MAG: hypothetical protein JW902_00220 [Syntrophaceae bacterium]|nr:hypothetical protein [Syntrophaceae bacterium]